MDEEKLRRKLNRLREIFKVSKTPSDLKIAKKFNTYTLFKEYTIANYRDKQWAIQSADFLSVLETPPKSLLIELLRKLSIFLCIPIFEANALFPDTINTIKTLMVIGTTEDIKLCTILIEYIIDTEKYLLIQAKSHLESLDYDITRHSTQLNIKRGLKKEKHDYYILLHQLLDGLLERKKSEIHIWENHTINKLESLKEFIQYNYKREYEPENIKIRSPKSSTDSK